MCLNPAEGCNNDQSGAEVASRHALMLVPSEEQPQFYCLLITGLLVKLPPDQRAPEDATFKGTSINIQPSMTLFIILGFLWFRSR